MEALRALSFIGVTGIGATAVGDAWALLRRRWLGTALPNYVLVGRWIGHMRHGRFRHSSLMKATPVKFEAAIGWTAHYLIGMAFAALPVLSWNSWTRTPTITQGVLVGLVTVAAPFFVMQPAMGAGIAASRTPNPRIARLHSLVYHLMFGLGLYLSARILAG
jgi:hypothetical protein